jgi:hypothetical protein
MNLNSRLPHPSLFPGDGWETTNLNHPVHKEQLNERYFMARADGLRLSAVGLAMPATAWE